MSVCVCGGCVRVCVRTRVTRSLYSVWRRETQPRPYSGTETTNTSTLLITAGSRWVCVCVWRVCACMCAYEGYPITLHCVAMGDPTPAIQWDRNNKYINPVNNSRFMVSVCVCGGCVHVCVCTRVTRSLYTVWRRETQPQQYSGTETTNTSTLLITAGSRWVCVCGGCVRVCVRTRVTRSLYTAWRRETRPRPYSGTETTNTSTLLITAGSRWVCACVWRVCACMRAYEGYPITLHCVATGDPTPTIQWDRNNKYINPVNNSRFTVSVRVCAGCMRVCAGCVHVCVRQYSGTESTWTLGEHQCHHVYFRGREGMFFMWCNEG